MIVGALVGGYYKGNAGGILKWAVYGGVIGLVGTLFLVVLTLGAILFLLIHSGGCC
jgi:hypothetical protein